MARKVTAKTSDPTSFRLPATVCTPADITQLARELESLQVYLQQAKLRGSDITIPKLSQGFSDLTGLNRLDLSQAEDRKLLAAFLQIIHSKAPVLHISFGSEPSSAFMARIITWLREHISPFALVRIGRQPAIGGGCILRTTNKQFDFSFRQYLEARRPLFRQAMTDVDTPSKAAA